ncbi:TRASH domain-containing protein, partial [Vibrio anguillarum]|nr:TRASH domain-containing protein [Vibrio anguillarum]
DSKVISDTPHIFKSLLKVFFDCCKGY